MQDTKPVLTTDVQDMPNVDDLIKHQDTDAMKWALAFKRVIIENGFDMDTMKDESYMVGWFANAMMTQHDWAHNNKVTIDEIQVVEHPLTEQVSLNRFA